MKSGDISCKMLLPYNIYRTSPRAGILGGFKALLGIDFNLQDDFEEYFSEEQRTFSRPSETYCQRIRTGQPACSRLPFIRSFLSKALSRISTMSDQW
jgi:hypothetical protein